MVTHRSSLHPLPCMAPAMLAGTATRSHRVLQAVSMITDRDVMYSPATYSCLMCCNHSVQQAWEGREARLMLNREVWCPGQENSTALYQLST